MHEFADAWACFLISALKGLHKEDLSASHPFLPSKLSARDLLSSPADITVLIERAPMSTMIRQSVSIPHGKLSPRQSGSSQPARSMLKATYRLQLHSDFTFRQAAALTTYL